MLEKLPDALGHALRHRRAGLDKLAIQQVDLRQGHAALAVGSLAFEDHAPMPVRFTADGLGVSPPLHWSGVPDGAGSVVVIVEDADAPTPQPLVHLILVSLPGEDGSLPEDAVASPALDDSEPAAGTTGRNSFLGARWLPPDPPPGHGTHRYAVQVFALEPGAVFGGTPGREAVLTQLAAHGIASGMLVGTYERPDGSVRDDAPATASATAVGPVST